MIPPEHRIVDMPRSRDEPPGWDNRAAWIRSGEIYIYRDADDVEVLQARFYDPSCLSVVGPLSNGTMMLADWGGGRRTKLAFPQCVDCIYAGRYVVPTSQTKQTPNIYYNATAVCLRHLPDYTLGVASTLEWVNDREHWGDQWLVFPAKGWELP